MIPDSEFQERRIKLGNMLGKGLYILPSYPERLFSNDTFHPYRQQTELYYFTGITEPETVAVLENDGEKLVYTLFIRDRDPVREVYDGVRFDIETAKSKFMADEVEYMDQFPSKIFELLQRNQKVCYLDDQHPDIDNVIQENIKLAKNSRARIGTGPVLVYDPTDDLHEIRVQKSDTEIELLRTAAKISANAIKVAIQKTKDVNYEYEIQSIIEGEFRKNGAELPAYGSICAGGKNAVVLHYMKNSDSLHPNELLLVDAGAQYKYYSSDITRTWPISGKFTETQSNLYSTVLEVQKSCIDMIEPDISFGDVTRKSDEMLVEALIKLELLEGEVDKILEEGSHRRFIRHGLGHWVGIDVHDTSRYSILSNNLPIGSYLTIEPGLYIPGDNDIPEHLRNIGIRIEDDILVTEKGHEVLTKDVAKEISEIEKLMS